jgi:hypothetical protein
MTEAKHGMGEVSNVENTSKSFLAVAVDGTRDNPNSTDTFPSSVEDEIKASLAQQPPYPTLHGWRYGAV